jgi:hypothetical protein
MNNKAKIAAQELIIAYAQAEIEGLKSQKDERFKPEIGEVYWFIKDNGQADYNHWTNDTFDVHVWDNFNCYETEELATKAAVMMKRNNAIIMACLMVDPDFVPDYLSGRKHFAFSYKNTEIGCHAGWSLVETHSYDFGPCVGTKEKWEEAAALLKEWGVE